MQALLLQAERQRLNELAQRVAALQGQIDDKDALAEAVAPVLGEAIRRQISESREEIVDALYPIIGQIVMKAVTEAIRDLAQAVDERVHAALDFKTIWRRIKAWVTGVPEGELALREALPFTVHEVYLIHRENGLLLWYRAREGRTDLNADLVGAMLTAIRDFAGQVLGNREDSTLDELQFGKYLILLALARHAYVAIVCDGTPPAGFRIDLGRRIHAFESATRAHLHHFNGDASPLADPAETYFQDLLGSDLPASG